MNSIQTPPVCEFPTNKKETKPYYEYYLGDKDDQDRRQGQGRNCWTEAESIEWHCGSFARDTMHGNGVYRWRFRGPENRHVSYEGRLYVNQLHGYGAMSYGDGKVFTGLFYNDVRYGPGVETLANVHANVGLWRGTRLVRLAWRPLASVAVDLQVWPDGRTLVEPYRIVLDATCKTLGKVNQAVELLKQHGSDPVSATVNWSRLYPKHCTDVASQLCHVEFFQNQYYNGKIYSLKQQGSALDNDEELETASLDSHSRAYYAWNNNEVAVDMMKHCFMHERQRSDVNVDLVSMLNGYRKEFKPPAMHELDCRTLLVASYLGHVASTTHLVNERDVDPNVADMLGNTALMYATYGDHTELIHFLVEAGASVNSMNDSCCTALAIALIRYVCAKYDVPINGMQQALIPPVDPLPTNKSMDLTHLLGNSPEPQTVFDWLINRDPQAAEALKNTPSMSPSKTNKTNIDQPTPITRRKTEIIKPMESTISRRKTDIIKPYEAPTTRRKTETIKPPEEEPKKEPAPDECLNNEDQLYVDVYNEYIKKVNDQLETAGEPVKYLFGINDMVHEIIIYDEQQRLAQKPASPQKNAKKKISKVLKEVMKQSKEAVSRTGLKTGFGSPASVEMRKEEVCSQIMSTILELLANGADPTLVKCPQPALFLAIVAGCARLAEHLVDHGADVNEVYPQLLNYTPLDVAVSLPLTPSTLETVRALLAAGARAYRRIPADGDGPTLLHAVMARKAEKEVEEDIRRQIMQLLIKYDCDPLARYKGRSALEDACKSQDLVDIIIRSPGTDLNAAINDSNQTILVKMFHMPYFRTLQPAERSQTLTNLLLFGADPLIECENQGIKYANLFVMAKKNLTGAPEPTKVQQSPSKTKLNQAKGQKEQNRSPEIKKEPKKDPKKDTKKETKKDDASSAAGDGAYRANLKQAIDLMTECTRILYVRWLQAKLAKELVHVIARYKQRHWSMIIKEHNNPKACSLWLTAQRSLEIWGQLRNSKIKVYKDKDVLWRLLCISHFYHLRSMTNRGFNGVTAVERDDTESYVNCILKENKKSHMLTLPRYVQPELFHSTNSKFEVCFECFLPLTESQIPCDSCEVVSFCNMECLRESINKKSNGHACNDYLILMYLPSSTHSGSEPLQNVEQSMKS